MVEKPDADWLEPPRFTAAEYSSMAHSFGMEADAHREGQDIKGVGDFKGFGGRDAVVKHLEHVDLKNAPEQAREAFNMLLFSEKAERQHERGADDDDRER